jgi:hypothetical protein
MRMHISFSREKKKKSFIIIIIKYIEKWFVIIWHKEKMNETNVYMPINEG